MPNAPFGPASTIGARRHSILPLACILRVRWIFESEHRHEITSSALGQARKTLAHAIGARVAKCELFDESRLGSSEVIQLRSVELGPCSDQAQ